MPKNKLNMTFSINSKYRDIIMDPTVTIRLTHNIERWLEVDKRKKYFKASRCWTDSQYRTLLEEDKRKNHFKASRYWKYYILGWVLGVICLLIPIILFIFEMSTHCEYDYSIFIAIGAEWILLKLAHEFHKDCPYDLFKNRI